MIEVHRGFDLCFYLCPLLHPIPSSFAGPAIPDTEHRAATEEPPLLSEPGQLLPAILGYGEPAAPATTTTLAPAHTTVKTVRSAGIQLVQKAGRQP